MNANRVRAQRAIRIGWLVSGYYVVTQSSGHPNGYRMGWAGRGSVFQPAEFREWASAWWAVRRRLSLAGLLPVAVWSRWPARRMSLIEPSEGSHRAELWVMVRRATNRRRKQSHRSVINAGHGLSKPDTAGDEQAEVHEGGTGEGFEPVFSVFEWWPEEEICN